jgi:hypothetical protein
MALFSKKRKEVDKPEIQDNPPVEAKISLQGHKDKEGQPKLTLEQEQAVELAKEYLRTFDGLFVDSARTDNLLLAVLFELKQLNFKMNELLELAKTPDELPKL